MNTRRAFPFFIWPESSLLTFCRMWRHQIIASCPCKHHSLLEAAISALGMIPRILGSRSSFRHLLWSSLENLIILWEPSALLFPPAAVFISWRWDFRSMICQSALSERHCNHSHSELCQRMDSIRPLIGSFEFQGSVIPAIFMVLGCVLYEKWEDSNAWNEVICGHVCAPVVCAEYWPNGSLRCKFYFLFCSDCFVLPPDLWKSSNLWSIHAAYMLQNGRAQLIEFWTLNVPALQKCRVQSLP